MMAQRARRTELQRTVSGLFCIESRVSIAFPLFNLFTELFVIILFRVLGISAFLIPRFR